MVGINLAANMERRSKVYLAGPDVFLADAAAAGERKKRLCAAYGFEGLFPADADAGNEPGLDDAPLDLRIFRANVALMADCDLGILNLTPFRGPSADVGTVFELGLLFGLGKPVYGYSNVSEDLLVRVSRWPGAAFDRQQGRWLDLDGLLIEDFHNADNLMIDAALRERGYPLYRHAAAAENLYDDLTGFEACLKRAAADFALPMPVTADLAASA